MASWWDAMNAESKQRWLEAGLKKPKDGHKKPIEIEPKLESLEEIGAIMVMSPGQFKGVDVGD